MKRRHTDQRQAILRQVKLSTEPISALNLAKKLKFSGIGRATVFRNLRRLVREGELVAVEGTGGRIGYVGHAWHEAEFYCVRCGRRRSLKHKTLPGYVDRKMFGHQVIITSQLKAQGLCGKCARR